MTKSKPCGEEEASVPTRRGRRQASLDVLPFAAALLVHLIPVWFFSYLPTQDGPSHLHNSIILKEYGSPRTRYHEFIELRWEALPNWSSQLVLVLLLYVFKPLVAEKILTSLYVVGFPWSLRYFLGAFGAERRALAPIGLFFVWNRCFLMGFYNYCLSLILFWLVMGYFLRHCRQLRVYPTAALSGFLLLCYFTHLVGYVMTAGGILLVSALTPGRRMPRILCLIVAILPSACLLMWFLMKTEFPSSSTAFESTHFVLGVLEMRDGITPFLTALGSLNGDLFRPYDYLSTAWGFVILLIFEFLLVVTLLSPRLSGDPKPWSPPRFAIAIMGLGISLLFFLLPDSFGRHGGFLKARLAILPPLLWLACLRMPMCKAVRNIFLVAVYLLVGINLWSVVGFFWAANQDIAAFTSGVDHVGHDRTLIAYQSDEDTRPINYLFHASDYYCLGTGNIDLGNYEAGSLNFPTRFQPKYRGLGRRLRVEGLRAFPVDVILVWGPLGPVFDEPIGRYREVYSNGRLKVYEAAGFPDP
jgi:hypothetical protein